MTDSLTFILYLVVGLAGVLLVAGLELAAAWLLTLYGEHKWRRRAQRRGGYIFDHADYPHDFVPARHE